jgi:hypothetical protein
VERGAKAPRLVHEGRVFTRCTNLPDRCVGKLEGRVPKSQSLVVKDAVHEPLTNNVCRNNRPAARQSQASTGGSGENFTLCSAKVVKQPGGGSCLFHSPVFGINGMMAWSARQEEHRHFADSSSNEFVEKICLSACGLNPGQSKQVATAGVDYKYPKFLFR